MFQERAYYWISQIMLLTRINDSNKFYYIMKSLFCRYYIIICLHISRYVHFSYQYIHRNKTRAKKKREINIDIIICK